MDMHAINGNHAYAWMSLISMESMELHGFHGYCCNLWISVEYMVSMESMDIHGIAGDRGSHGYACNQ